MLSLLRRIKNKVRVLFINQEKLDNERENEFINNRGFTVVKDAIEFKYIAVEQNVIGIRKNTSDFLVFKQVFIDKEYDPVLSYFRNNQATPQFVIDAGANIGLTTIFIKNNFPDAKVVCIEPDKSNFSMLENNLANFIQNQSVFLENAGLMGRLNLNLGIGESFRGGGAWAKQTIISDQESDIKSTTIPELLDKYGELKIDLLKIDIEGAETFLLENETDLSFLERTKVIAIEIHDEYDCRAGIYALLRHHGFMLMDIAETTIAINKLHLND